jgi:hypothetical protein
MWSETVAAFPVERVLYDREDPARMVVISWVTYRAEVESVGRGYARYASRPAAANARFSVAIRL